MVPLARADHDVRADKRARRTMEEHRLVQKGTAIERYRVELLHRTEKRVVRSSMWSWSCGLRAVAERGPTTFADPKRPAVARAPR